MSGRPGAAVVVPFLGSNAELQRLRERLSVLRLAAGDELIVCDNRAHPVKTPAYARNRGAELTSAEWIVFLDADTTPAANLLDAYFDPPPDAHTAVLVGGIEDRAQGRPGLAGRYAVARGHMTQQSTLARSGTPYAQTANCAVRRSAFEAVGAFTETARAGEDADLCFRLQRAGWRLEPREQAAVTHQARATLRTWLSQLAVHGSGAAWLERRWPGEFPRQRPAALLRRLGRHLVDAVWAALRGEREQAGFALLDFAGACAFELGRLLPNERRPQSLP